MAARSTSDRRPAADDAKTAAANSGKNTPRITDRFTPAEIACKCGNDFCERPATAIAASPTFELAQETADALASIRQQYDKPLFIASAHRCQHHPIARKKKRPGAHTQGTAIDITLPANAADKHKLLMIVCAHNPKGIGIGKTFIHADWGHKHAPRPAFWRYQQ